MCFNKKRIKKLQDSVSLLQKTVDELQNTIVTQELIRLRNESKEFSEIRERLSKLKLRLKSIKLIDNGESVPHLEVSYEVPQCHVFFDGDGKLVKNDIFLSINRLGLLPMKDYEKIEKEIKKAKNKLFQLDT